MLISWKSLSGNYEHSNYKTLFCPQNKVLHVPMLFQIDSASFCFKFCWVTLKVAVIGAAWYNCMYNEFFCKYKHAVKSHVIDLKE